MIQVLAPPNMSDDEIRQQLDDFKAGKPVGIIVHLPVLVDVAATLEKLK